MKLTELEPRWIHLNLFVFLCPHCRKQLLSCKNVAMTAQEQYDIFEREFGEDATHWPVATRDGCAWSIGGTVPANPDAAFVEDLSVTPSIDASASGHWHGYITKGEIV